MKSILCACVAMPTVGDLQCIVCNCISVVSLLCGGPIEYTHMQSDPFLVFGGTCLRWSLC